jgi:hypothetical protein
VVQTLKMFLHDYESPEATEFGDNENSDVCYIVR